ncbi:MAG: DUF465 domain-containing protein [Bacteroidales bacterium]|nr:DUF465 domain-containing protein [Bacteroidales bacterium]
MILYLNKKYNSLTKQIHKEQKNHRNHSQIFLHLCDLKKRRVNKELTNPLSF